MFFTAGSMQKCKKCGGVKCVQGSGKGVCGGGVGACVCVVRYGGGVCVGRRGGTVCSAGVCLPRSRVRVNKAPGLVIWE